MARTTPLPIKELPIESLAQSLNRRFPDAQVVLDRPRKASGVWFLNITLDDHPVVVQWQEGKDFGISSSPKHAYGERADEVYKNDEAAYGRIISLLLSRTFTSSPPAVSLRELRRESGLSQAELAVILNSHQGEISKIERRKDIHVSTLFDYVRALQADLQMTVRWKDGRSQRIELEESQDTDSRPAAVLSR